MKPPRYQSGAAVVEAMQWPCGESYDDVCARAAIHRWVWGHDGRTWVTHAKANPDDVYVSLETMSGRQRVDGGTWILRDHLNFFYTCASDEFVREWSPA